MGPELVIKTIVTPLLEEIDVVFRDHEISLPRELF
jgi:hypothetical protein